MIGSLRGRLLDRRADEVLVEVAGVGYRVLTSPATAQTLGGDGEVFLWIHHHLREDAETLYGFATREELLGFEALLGAHGVGPALALAILSVHPPDDLARIVHGDDVAGLCLVPGVGKKTAARLLIELKPRFEGMDTAGAGSAPPGAAAGPASGEGAGDVRADVRAALAELGYGPDEIRKATAALPDGGDVGELLREALSTLASGRSQARA